MVTIVPDRVLYFGCWNGPGHYLVGPGGRSHGLTNQEAYNLLCALDGVLAPKRTRAGQIVFGDLRRSPNLAHRDAVECEQGLFLRHRLGRWTLIQWWDRCQGDKRGGCNSTVLLEGEHSSEEMLAALAQHFPHVLENLTRAGVELKEVPR